VFSVSACKKDTTTTTPPENNTEGAWLIPKDEVRDGGPGKDGIPSIDSPNFIAVNQVNFLSNDDLIIGLKIGDEVRGYPHPILDWHEIINDQIGNDAVAVTYCPLTGTAVGWDRVINGKTTTFGVSGLLYNSNLLPYDRETDSNWSQMRLDCVHGELKGTEINTYHLLETDWETWKKKFPDSKVVSTETGFNRNYDNYPYGSYRTDSQLIFGVDNSDDDRLARKERVYGAIIFGRVKTYRFSSFSSEKVVVIEDNHLGENYIVVGSQQDNYIVAYRNTLDGTKLNFTAINDNSDDNAVVLEDNEGNKWDLFGVAISGPRTGQQLEPIVGYMGYWFSWAAFYPTPDIFGE